MTFRLTIRLGNAAMQSGADVADALESVAGHIRDADADDMSAVHGRRILDTNGNTVGEWIVGAGDE